MSALPCHKPPQSTAKPQVSTQTDSNCLSLYVVTEGTPGQCSTTQREMKEKQQAGQTWPAPAKTSGLETNASPWDSMQRWGRICEPLTKHSGEGSLDHSIMESLCGAPS